MTTTFLLINVALGAAVVGLLAFTMTRIAQLGSSLELVPAEARNAERASAPALPTHRRTLARHPQAA
jgi:hypothetical protein